MLVLTRRESEEIVIGDPENPLMRIRVASLTGDRVRLSFEAEKAIPVHRREVADDICREREDARRMRGMNAGVGGGVGVGG